MNWFCEFSAFFQSLHVTKVSHPTVNILQVKDLENRILTHLGIQGIDDATLFEDGNRYIQTIPADGEWANPNGKFGF